MEPEKALPALQARDFDLVLAEEHPGNPNPRPAELEQQDLLDAPLHLALPDPADGSDAAAPMAALRSPADHPWVMEPEGTAARHWAMTLCRNAGFEPDVRFETTDLLLHLRLVEQKHAAAFLPGLVWRGQPPTVALARLPPRPAHAPRLHRGTPRQRPAPCHPGVPGRTAPCGHPPLRPCMSRLRKEAEQAARRREAAALHHPGPARPAARPGPRGLCDQSFGRTAGGWRPHG